jgi:hypothetical protein
MSAKCNSEIAVIGIDVGKNSFHIVGLDRRGARALRGGSSSGARSSVRDPSGHAAAAPPDERDKLAPIQLIELHRGMTWRTEDDQA